MALEILLVRMKILMMKNNERMIFSGLLEKENACSAKGVQR